MTVPTVEQSYYEVDRRFKIELLTRLIDIHDLKLGIIFCNTKQRVNYVTIWQYLFRASMKSKRTNASIIFRLQTGH